jgi:hypothetical protein
MQVLCRLAGGKEMSHFLIFGRIRNHEILCHDTFIKISHFDEMNTMLNEQMKQT